MNEFFATYPLSATTLKWCVAILVVVVDNYLIIPKQFHPLTLVSLLSKRIDQKVRPNHLASSNQALISGALSYVVLFVPLLLVLYVLISYAHVHIFFDFILVWIACSYSSQKETFRKIHYALARKKKLLARQWLSTMVMRDTKNLSNLGICKAAIESLFLRYVYQLITPLFVFLLTGPVFALAYRIALECYWQWKRPYSKQSNFARPVQLFCKICQLLPMCIVVSLAFLFILKRNTKTQNREYISTEKPAINIWKLQPFLLSVLAKRLGFSLAGPLQYQGVVIRLPRYGSSVQIRLSDMKAATHSVTALSTIVVTMLVAGCLLVAVI